MIRLPHVELGPREGVEGAQQILARVAAADVRQPRALGLGRHVGILQPRRIHRHEQQVARRPGQLAAQDAQVVAALDRRFHQRERGGTVLVGHRVEHVEYQVAADQPQHRGDVVDREGVAGERPHLIEGAQRIAHAALAGPGQQQQRVVGHRDALLAGDVAEAIGDGLGSRWS